MQQFLVSERTRDPNLRTQESYAVSALLDRLMFITGRYRDVYLEREDQKKLSSNVGKALNSDVFSLLQHLPRHSKRVPRVDLSSSGPRIPFQPMKWLNSLELLIALYEVIVDTAGEFDEDHSNPVDVEVRHSWDAENRRVVFVNEDGNFINRFIGMGLEREAHLVPGPLRKIYAFARKVAPAGRMFTIVPEKGLLYVPIAIIDSISIPQSPNMAKFSRPHPSLFGPRQGE